MRNKSQQAYKGVFRYVNDLCTPQWRPEIIMTDFETALRNAARLTWPAARLVGCFFHYSQAVYRMHTTLRLRPLTDSNLEAGRALDMLMALCLLPADRIRTGLEVVQHYLVQHNLHRTFRPLMMYMDNFWMQRVGANTFSVFGLQHRTNNALEGFYSQLLRRMGPHPGVWDFNGHLRQIEAVQWRQYLLLSSGVRHVRPVRLHHRNQDRNINDASARLQQGACNEAEFLNTLAHSTRRLQERLGAQRPHAGDRRPAVPQMPPPTQNQVPVPVQPAVPAPLPPPVAQAAPAPAPQAGQAPAPQAPGPGMCAVCLIQNATHVVIPCGHMCICTECAGTLPQYQAVPRCPLCRQACEGVVRVFF